MQRHLLDTEWQPQRGVVVRGRVCECGVLQQHQPATDLAASTDKPVPALTPDLATSAHHPPSSIDPSTADERAFGIHWMLLR